MSTVGTLVFCSDCGNLLDSIAGSDRIECEMCGAVTKGSLSCAKFEKEQILTETLQTPEAKVSLHNPHLPPSRQLYG